MKTTTVVKETKVAAIEGEQMYSATKDNGTFSIVRIGDTTINVWTNAEGADMVMSVSNEKFELGNYMDKNGKSHKQFARPQKVSK